MGTEIRLVAHCSGYINRLLNTMPFKLIVYRTSLNRA